jgi:hypothetical protein
LNHNSLAFRAQLAVPELRKIYDYWLSLCKDGVLPSRADIKPSAIPRLLPGVSLVEVSNELYNSRIRLAGTRLREVYEREITGLLLSDLEWGDKRDYWLAAYDRVARQGIPAQGVVIGPRIQKDHLVQYWIRLPLRLTGPGIGLVFCYDHFLAGSERIENDLAESA